MVDNYAERLQSSSVSDYVHHKCICMLIQPSLLRTTNQFVSYRAPAKTQLKVGNNELILHFESAFLKVGNFPLG